MKLKIKNIWLWLTIGTILILSYPAYVLISTTTTWIRLALYDTPIPFTEVLGQRLRGAPTKDLARCFTSLKKASLSVDMAQLETHSVTGGDIILVTESLIAADRAAIPLDFKTAAAIDLCTDRRDINLLQAIELMTHPQIMKIPENIPGHETLHFATANGSILEAQILVTYRSDLSRLVGGAGLDTLRGRVADMASEVVATIEKAELAIASVAEIGRTIQRSKPDAGHAYEVLAIDVRLWNHGAVQGR